MNFELKICLHGNKFKKIIIKPKITYFFPTEISSDL